MVYHRTARGSLKLPFPAASSVALAGCTPENNAYCFVVKSSVRVVESLCRRRNTVCCHHLEERLSPNGQKGSQYRSEIIFFQHDYQQELLFQNFKMGIVTSVVVYRCNCFFTHIHSILSAMLSTVAVPLIITHKVINRTTI